MNVLHESEEDYALTGIQGITVILVLSVIFSTVIVSLVLSTSQPMVDEVPQTEFDIDFQQETATVTHVGGEPLDSDRITIRTTDGKEYRGSFNSDSITARDSVAVDNTREWNGETVVVVWSTESADNSAVLAKETSPSY